MDIAMMRLFPELRVITEIKSNQSIHNFHPQGESNLINII